MYKLYTHIYKIEKTVHFILYIYVSVLFSSGAQSCPTLSNTMACTSGFPVHHQLPELAQTHAHRIGDTIQPSHLIYIWSFVISVVQDH